MLLPLVHQNSQVPLVDLVRASSGLEVVGQSSDLCGKDGSLYLAATSVGTDSWCPLELSLWSYRFGNGGLACEVCVGIVTAKGGNAALDVDA